MWITGDGRKNEDISLCFRHFPQFREDFLILSSEGFIERIGYDHYKWKKSKLSLAKYFRWLGDVELENLPIIRPIEGGFWNPIVIVFGGNSRDYSNMSRRNSKTFDKLKKIVMEYRKKIKQQKEKEQKDRETFSAIKILIDKTNGDDIKEIMAALENIKSTLI